MITFDDVDAGGIVLTTVVHGFVVALACGHPAIAAPTRSGSQRIGPAPWIATFDCPGRSATLPPCVQRIVAFAVTTGGMSLFSVANH